MKNAFLMTLSMMTLISVSVKAEVTLSLPKGTAKISAIAADRISYDVKTAVPNCPPGVMCEMVSVMKLNVRLAGCVDSAELLYNTENVEGTQIVTVTALNIHNPKSASVKCIVMPTKSFSIRLGFGMVAKNNVRLVVSEYSARKD